MNITRPTFLINRAICERNLARMAEKAHASGIRFRPHFKTHQRSDVGEWFWEFGIGAITVSSVSMAEYFSNYEWNDITIAVPLNILEMDAVNRLAKRLQIGVLVESESLAQALIEQAEHPLNVWLEIDAGYHRTGIPWDDAQRVKNIAEIITSSQNCKLRGLLSHAGHSYGARGETEIRAVWDETLKRITATRTELEKAGHKGLELSPGDTPCCSIIDDFSAVDEIRPGNFLFYDVMQTVIGSCTVEDIGVAVACPVISKQVYEGAYQITVYGGGVHLSKDSVVDAEGRHLYGLVAHLTRTGWDVVDDGSYVKGLSQEHGVIHASKALYDQVNVGDVLAILPVHSCLAGDLLMDHTVIME